MNSSNPNKLDCVRRNTLLPVCVLTETYLNPNDHEWIGAWWIGYFLFAALITIFVPFMGLFPRKIPLKGANLPITNFYYTVYMIYNYTKVIRYFHCGRYAQV